MSVTAAWGPIGDKAQEIFETNIRPQVAEQNLDWFLAIDVDSGDYEVGEDDITPSDALRARHPNARVFLRRVGDDAAYFMGGGRLS